MFLRDPRRDAVTLFRLGEKVAAETAPAYNLAGRLYVTTYKGRPWGLLTVPNALVRGIFAAMHEPGAELPSIGQGEPLNAHITVFRAEEIEQLGGPDALLNDRGKEFSYTLGRLETIEPPDWEGIARCWMLRVYSPELQQLRRSYGLSSLPNQGQHDFHITVAVRRRGVLGRTPTAKAVA